MQICIFALCRKSHRSFCFHPFQKIQKPEERSNASGGGNERKKRENNRSAAGVLNHRCSLKGIMVKKNSGAEQKPKNGIKKPSPGTQSRLEIVMKLLILMAKEI